MPLHEYYCEPCDHHFEILIRNSAERIVCPQCGAGEVTRQLSIPAAAQTGRARSGNLPIHGDAGDGPSFGCGRPECGGGLCAGLD
jgi:putative FmdB family regulatory protein